MCKLQPLLLMVSLCVSCGGAFEAASGQGGSGGTDSGGSAGAPNFAGNAASAAGEAAMAGTLGASGSGSAAAGSGGAAAGRGSVGSAGAGGSVDCTALKEEYRAAVQKARVCDKGSTNQCSANSVLQPVGCGCPVLVNSKSAFTALANQKYRAIQENKCDAGPICDIACLPFVSAECASQSMTSGELFVCSGKSGLTTP